MEQSRLTLLGVPIDSVGRAGGTEYGPETLRKELAGLDLDDAGDSQHKVRGLERDPVNGWLAYEDVLRMSAELRPLVAGITAKGQVPVILGGCCTLVPAAVAGTRDSLGEIGLVYLDGHLDLFTGGTSPTGEGADMPAAAMLGLAPPEICEVIGPVPVVDPSRMIFVGARDQEELDLIAPLPSGTGIARIEDRNALRHADLTHLGRSIESELTTGGAKFWLHLDVDILDRQVFPATDYLMPDGLSLPELRALMLPLAGSPGLAGINLTCFNPERDSDGNCAASLVDLLKSTLIS
jgi:arginase